MQVISQRERADRSIVVISLLAANFAGIVSRYSIDNSLFPDPEPRYYRSR
jgi:hypothetical protein